MLTTVTTTRSEIQLDFARPPAESLSYRLKKKDINKIFIFSTLKKIHQLCNADRIYCDGTFYTAPHMFDSIFTIHAFDGSAMFPLYIVFTKERQRHIHQTLHSSPTNMPTPQPDLIANFSQPEPLLCFTYCTSKDFPNSGTQNFIQYGDQHPIFLSGTNLIVCMNTLVLLKSMQCL